MRIFLIGFMGSGKSTIGRSLASKLEVDFVDLDNYIQESQNMTISEIFEAHGEDGFRKIEAKCLKEVAKIENGVISTGGGTPCWGDNMKFIKKQGVSIYLKCSTDRLVDRLMNSKNRRPLIEGKSCEELIDFIDKTLEKREDYYSQASVIIANPSRDVTQILEVLSYYKTN